MSELMELGSLVPVLEGCLQSMNFLALVVTTVEIFCTVDFKLAFIKTLTKWPVIAEDWMRLKSNFGQNNGTTRGTKRML